MTAACLNEVQFPEELQPGHSGGACAWTSSLNEVQFPEELQQEPALSQVAAFFVPQ